MGQFHEIAYLRLSLTDPSQVVVGVETDRGLWQATDARWRRWLSGVCDVTPARWPGTGNDTVVAYGCQV